MLGCRGITFGRARRAVGRARMCGRAGGLAGTLAGVTIHPRARSSPEMGRHPASSFRKKDLRICISIENGIFCSSKVTWETEKGSVVCFAQLRMSARVFRAMQDRSVASAKEVGTKERNACLSEMSALSS
ncbi:hypothetical protein CRG98_005367 [Punica granatum]|uniref:Uncharacterized protein n=1 Tax=Punica granatum TaxID=22663 RepID=A0A2I0L258_PUNGR|nr:hypothetical protein CRG98_005367 [Punica granatum]